MMNIHSGEALCAACSWAARCTIPEESGEPISSCSHFSPFNRAMRSDFSEAAEENQDGPGWVPGICRDCNNRNSCMFEQRVGGTWFCEEYR